MAEQFFYLKQVPDARSLVPLLLRELTQLCLNLAFGARFEQVEFLGRSATIICQNENGPCPLLGELPFNILAWSTLIIDHVLLSLTEPGPQPSPTSCLCVATCMFPLTMP